MQTLNLTFSVQARCQEVSLPLSMVRCVDTLLSRTWHLTPPWPEGSQQREGTSTWT